MAVQRTNGSEAGFSDHQNDDGKSESGTLDPGNDGEVIYTSEPDAGIPYIEPETIRGDSDSSSGEPTRKRRGRPAGSRNATSKGRKESASDLGQLLLGVHFMLATITSTPELELDPTEAKKLGEAVAKVNDLYNGFFLTDKQMAWANLAFVGGSIYGPRIAARAMRMKKDKDKKDGKVQTIDGQGRVM